MRKPCTQPYMGRAVEKLDDVCRTTRYKHRLPFAVDCDPSFKGSVHNPTMNGQEWFAASYFVLKEGNMVILYPKRKKQSVEVYHTGVPEHHIQRILTCARQRLQQKRESLGDWWVRHYLMKD